MKTNKKKSIDAMKDLQVLEKENLKMICGGNGNIPEGWIGTCLANGDIRYDGPNGSFFIVHNALP